MNVKRGQVSIFVIIAVIIVALVFGFFLLRGEITIVEIPASLEPVEEYFLSCIEENAEEGIEILSSKGGFIYLPDFEAGSEHMPSSNYLNFLGSNIPYWYYVSGNNIVREQMPNRNDMENQLEKYLEENLDCDFSDFRGRGFDVELGEFSSDAKISDINVEVAVSGDLDIGFGEDNTRISNHKAKVNTKLGKLYSEAVKIYNFEKQNSFLENYAADVLRMYAPVDGVEMSCAPKIWLKNDIDNDLKIALENNVQAIRFGVKGENYFVQDLSVDDSVNVLYDRNFPTRIEVFESKDGVMMAEPVGNQPGLGILGFCYVAYHFVYDIVFPSLIQVYDSNELFQFPVAVIIDDNKAREALPVNAVFDSQPELCKYPNKDVRVYTYDTNLKGVEADISFECLGQRCDIGRTKTEEENAVLNAKFPSCLNGFVSVKAEGYAGKRHMFSTNEESEANIILDKLYDLDLELRVDGEKTDNYAVINFVSEDNTQVVSWPEQQEVKLSEGYYNISVYVYRQSGISIPGMKKEVCNEVPSAGLLGIFGGTTEKCFDVDIPAQELTNVVSGGGKSSDYFIESQLQGNKVIVSVFSISVPSSIEQLQDTYNMLEVKPIYVEFE